MEYQGKVAIIQFALTHYRVPFFKSLFKKIGDHSILYYGKIEKERAPSQYNGELPFANIYVRNRKFKIFGYTLRWQSDIVRLFKNIHYDIIVCEGTYGIVSNWIITLWAYLHKTPVIFWTCEWINPDMPRIKIKLKRLFARIYYLLASGFIVYSENARRSLLRLGIRSDLITVAHNTIDVESIMANRSKFIKRGMLLREKLSLLDKKIILYVGTLIPEKRPLDLLKAYVEICKKIPRVSLIYVGDGPEMTNLMRSVKEYGLDNVLLEGFHLRDVDDYFAMCDVFAMPGIGGLAINQAMAHGKPIVTTGADGTADYLIDDGKNGFIIQPGDIHGMSSRIISILESEDRRIQMGKHSLTIIMERASLGNMVKNFVRALNKI